MVVFLHTRRILHSVSISSLKTFLDIKYCLWGRSIVGRVETISVLYEIVSRIYGVVKASVWQRAV